MLWSRWKWDRSILSLRSVSGRCLYSSMNLKGVCLWDFMVKLIDPTCVAFDVLSKFRSPSKRFARRRVIVAAVLTIDIWAHWDVVRKLSLLSSDENNTHLGFSTLTYRHALISPDAQRDKTWFASVMEHKSTQTNSRNCQMCLLELGLHRKLMVRAGEFLLELLTRAALMFHLCWQIFTFSDATTK